EHGKCNQPVIVGGVDSHTRGHMSNLGNKGKITVIDRGILSVLPDTEQVTTVRSWTEELASGLRSREWAAGKRPSRRFSGKACGATGNLIHVRRCVHPHGFSIQRKGDQPQRVCAICAYVVGLQSVEHLFSRMTKRIMPAYGYRGKARMHCFEEILCC